MVQIDLKNVTTEQLEEMLKQKKEQDRIAAQKKRDAFEGIRADVSNRIEQKVRAITLDVKSLFDFVVDETMAYYDVLKEYGQLKRDDQMSFSIPADKFKIEVKTNKVKKFDERADIAAARLIDYLQLWIKNSQKGVDDPMYQLAMTLLERNQFGDLDYKSISKLYDLESKFSDTEYGEIMQLFRESNIIEGTATNFYFWEKTSLGVWRKIEPSFNRM